MPVRKVAIGLVPGAWLPVSSYAALIECLQNVGYPTACTELPSLDPPHPAQSSIEEDAKYIRTTLLKPLIEEQGQDVVLLMHSYGAEPASVAANGFGKYERTKAGKKGGVLGFVALSAFILAPGASCADGQGGNLPPWVLQHTPSQDLTMPDKPGKYLFNNMPESAATLYESQIRPHARAPFYQPQLKTAWADPEFVGRLGYVMCKDDQAVPLDGQKAMVQYSGCTWNVVEVEGGHCVYIDGALTVANAVHELIESFSSFV